VFPAVVVDLGNQVSATEAAWVLAACNAAIVQGSCELDAPADTPPRAVAIVRLQGRGRRVRIEVGLRDSDRGAWSVREIEFSAKDPARERWRTVGLVLATLVGEAEAARAEDEASEAAGSAPKGAVDATVDAAANTTAESAASAPPATPEPAPAATPSASAAAEPPSAPETPPSAAAAPAPREAAAEVRAPASERDEDVPDALPAFPRHTGVFVGLGVLTSPAASGGDLPWGAALRGGVSFSSGWVLALDADYSHATFDARGYAVDSVRLAPGISYRLAPAEHWSIGLAAYAGVRALWATSSRSGAVGQDALSPFAGGSLELWWQALPIGGLWTALDLGSIGRVTRVLGRNAAFETVVPAADLRALVGFWAAL
jgi:hypothetical protein